MADIHDDLEQKKLARLFPTGLNDEQALYINSFKDEIVILSQHLYEVQKNLAQWMLSQKAFKETAIQLGLNQGLNIEEIIKKAHLIKEEVLKNNNNPLHGTNAFDSKFLQSNIDDLKSNKL